MVGIIIYLNEAKLLDIYIYIYIHTKYVCLNLDKKIVTSQEKNPSKIRWKENNVTYVIEATGVFTTLEKASVSMIVQKIILCHDRYNRKYYEVLRSTTEYYILLL